MEGKTFAEKFIGQREMTELDLEYPNYGPEKNGVGDEVRNEVMIPHQFLTFADAPSMSIKDAIRILQELQQEGADRVYIADHCDHHGYYFYGTKLFELK